MSHWFVVPESVKEIGSSQVLLHIFLPRTYDLSDASNWQMEESTCKAMHDEFEILGICDPSITIRLSAMSGTFIRWFMVVC